MRNVPVSGPLTNSCHKHARSIARALLSLSMGSQRNTAGKSKSINSPKFIQRYRYADTPRGIAATLTQNVYNGGRTGYAIGSAQSQVLAARENLRSIEQSVLFSSVTAFMNVLRDTAILDLRRNNVDVLGGPAAGDDGSF